MAFHPLHVTVYAAQFNSLRILQLQVAPLWIMPPTPLQKLHGLSILLAAAAAAAGSTPLPLAHPSATIRYEGRIVQQLIQADGGSGDYIELTPPMLGIWNTLLEGAADATWVRQPEVA